MIRVILFLGIIFFIGCSVKTQPIYAVIKTPKIKVSDQGFLKKGYGYKEIIVYKVGMEPIKFSIKNSMICINGKCKDKNKIIKELNQNYPNNFFDLILDKKPLKFLGKITFTKEGFIQQKNNILYKVTKNKVLFKDKNSKILIMIRFLKEKG